MAANDDFTRAEYFLEIWGDWCRSERWAVTKGFPKKSAGICTGGASEDFETLVDREDAKAAQTCDAIIWDLPQLYRLILEHKYVLRGALKSPRGDAQERLIDAQAAFWAKARKYLV